MAPRRPRHIIGLILSNVSNDFSGHLIEQMGEQFYASGYKLIAATTNHSIDYEREMLELFSKTTDGILIISDAVRYAELADAVPKRIPVIFLNRKPEGCPHTCIIENDYSAVFQSVLSGVSNGNDKIALICSNPQFSTTKEIVHAYRDAMSSTPTGFHEEWISYTDAGCTDIKGMITKIADQGCNTVFTCTQTLTRQYLDYLLIYNRDAKHPISLIGFSNKDSKHQTQHSFDSIAQPLQELVELAVQQMLYLIKFPATPAREYLLKGTLRTKILDVLNADKKQDELP